MNKYWKIGGLLVVLLGIIALAGTALTFAQDTADPDETDETTTETEAAPEDIPFNGRFGPHDWGPRGERIRQLVDQDAVQEAIAGALGITVEELEAAREAGTRLPELAAEQGVEMTDIATAVEAVMLETADAALANGDITQEQYDAFIVRQETMAQRREARNTYLDILFSELGITVEDVQSAHDTAVAELLAQGLITEEQAEAMQEMNPLGRFNGFGGRGFGPGGHGGPRGHGGHGGGPFGGPQG